MQVSDLQVTLQALSSLAIAGSLVYTGLQFRKSRKAAHVANFTKLVELQMHLREMRVHDPGLARVYHHDVRDAASDREIREYFFNLMQLSVFEIVWFSHANAQLPRDYYDGWVKRMRDIAAEESFQKMMRSPSMKILHDDFQAFVVSMMNEEIAKARATGARES